MVSNRDLQLAGEEAAASYLASQGYSIIARNWRLNLGEIDIVAKDGDALVFVEVKSRRSDAFIDPVLAVGYRKQARVRRVAEAYLAMGHPPGHHECRFDVISVVSGGGEPRLRHLRAAF